MRGLSAVLLVAAASAAAAGTMHFPLQRRALERMVTTKRRLFAEEAPIYGDFRQLAYYYADVWVGTPPTKYSVITDTGSTLMAFPCSDCSGCGAHQGHKFDGSASSTAAKVTCGAGCPSGSCDNGRKQCSYSQSYAEGSSLRGVYWRDRVWIGADVPAPAVTEGASYGVDFTFGCHTYENGLFTTQLADGIMGLGRDRNSIIATLRSAKLLDRQLFGMCLTLQGGAITLGGIQTDMHTGEVVWEGFKGSSGFYTVTTGEVKVGGASVHTGASSAIVDSGTSFSYLPSTTYRKVVSALKAAAAKVSGASLTTVRGEDLCYKFTNAGEQLKQMPRLSVAVGSIVFDMAPEHVFFNMAWDGAGAFCLGVYDNRGSSGVIGANAMMGYDVLFDLDANKLGVAPAHCAKPKTVTPVGDAPAPVPSPPAPAVSASATPPQTPHPSPSAGATPSSSTLPPPSPSQTAGTSPSSSPAAAAPSPVPKDKGSVGDGAVDPSPGPTLHWQNVQPGSVFGAGFAAGFAVLLALGLLCLGCVACRRSYVSLGGLVLVSTNSQLWVTMTDAQTRTAPSRTMASPTSKFQDRPGGATGAPDGAVFAGGEVGLGDEEDQVALARAAEDVFDSDE